MRKISVVGPGQHGDVVATLCAAFDDDPFFSWLFPDPARSPVQQQEWWSHLLATRPLGSEVWQAAQMAAAAYWQPPRGQAAVADDDGSAFVEWFIELLDAPDLVGPRLELFGGIVEVHPDDEHWYLPAVGTRPEHQGRGLGATILAPVLDRCDDDGLGAYLESSNPRNVPFYARLGFEVVGTLDLPDHSTHLTFMWREPIGFGA